MPTVNIFLGGSGVRSAALLQRRAAFYGYDLGFVFAIDTDPAPEPTDRRALGRNLILADTTFTQSMQQQSSRLSATNWSTMWLDQEHRRQPFSLTVLRADAETVHANLYGGAGLYTLRGAGWLAFEELERKNSEFVRQIAASVQRAAVGLSQGERVIVQIVASIAGGTGSGLFLPMLASLRAALSNSLEAAGQRRYEIHLLLITPSAFDLTWRNHEDEQTLRSRGFSGAYAAFREVEAICRPSDLAVDPFEIRPINGLELPPCIDRVYWLGRRAVDADLGVDSTLDEASRILALLNDDLLSRQVAGQLPSDPYTLLPSLTLLEYPKLEIAHSVAARSAGDLLDELRSGRSGELRSILDRIPLERGAVIDLIRRLRQPNGPLDSASEALNATIPGDEIVGPRGLYHELGLENSPGTLDRGEARRVPSYDSETTEDWLAYVATMWRALEDAEQRDLQVTEEVLTEDRRVNSSRILGSVVQTFEEVGVGPNKVSLVTARLAVASLIETLNLARLFFHRGFADVVATGHGESALRSVPEQAARVAAAESALTGDVRPEPAVGPIYSWAISAVLLGAGLWAFAAFLSSLELVGPLGIWVIPGMPALGTVSAGSQLLVAVLAVGLSVAHRIWVARSALGVPEIRHRLETIWIQEWSRLVVCRQLDLTFRNVERLISDLLYASESSSDLREGIRGYDLQSPVGQTVSLVDKAEGWLAELAGLARIRGDVPWKPYPQTAIQLATEASVPPGRLANAWPTLRAEMLVVAESHPVDLRVVPQDPSSSLLARLWSGPNERSSEQARDLRDRGLAFLEAVEDAIQHGIAEQRLLAGDLEEALSNSPGYNGPLELANKLNELIERANRRGAPGEFDAPPRGASSYVIAPSPGVAAQINEAIRLAQQSRGGQFLHLLTSLAEPSGGSQGYCLVSRHVGEAIAILQFRQFAWSDEEGAHLADVDRARRQHYAEGGTRGLDPQLHHDFNATNTEFYLLPELSSAAHLEVTMGLTNSIPRILVPRLYGSDLRVDTMPSMLDLFYFADSQGLLSMTQGGPRRDADRTNYDETWHLLETVGSLEEAIENGSAFPLVTFSLLGAPSGTDSLGEGRRRLIIFDAFVAAMGNRGGALGDRNVPRFRVHEARVPYEQWGEPAIAATLRRARAVLVEGWRQLSRNEGGSVYDRMYARAIEDAEKLGELHGTYWKNICEQQFRKSSENLHLSWAPSVHQPVQP